MKWSNILRGGQSDSEDDYEFFDAQENFDNDANFQSYHNWYNNF